MYPKRRRKQSFIRMNVSIPVELKNEMAPLNAEINWSLVATDAFRKVVESPPINETEEERINRRLNRKTITARVGEDRTG